MTERASSDFNDSFDLGPGTVISEPGAALMVTAFQLPADLQQKMSDGLSANPEGTRVIDQITSDLETLDLEGMK